MASSAKRAEHPNRSNACADIPNRTTVAIATACRKLRTLLVERIGHSPELSVWTCPFGDLTQLEASLRLWSPDVLLLDHSLVDGIGEPVEEHFASVLPGLRVLLICDREPSGIADDVARRRYCGFLLRTRAGDTYVKAVRTVAQGGLWLPRSLLEQAIVNGLPHVSQKAPLAGAGRLTKRERQVVSVLRQGCTNKEIADELGIQEDTVKKHLKNAYSKLGVHRRVEILVRPSAH